MQNDAFVMREENNMSNKIPCPLCGKQIVDTSAKCMFCNKIIPRDYSGEITYAPPQTESVSPGNNIDEVVCPGCGKKLPSSVRFCYMCGSSIPQTQGDQKTTLADLQQYNALQSQQTEVNGPDMNMLLTAENEQVYQQPQTQNTGFLHFAESKSFDEKWGNKSSTQTKSICCPKCRSTNVAITFQTVNMNTKNKAEVRKKSAAVRAANNIGRAGANLATAGLYGVFVPKRSAYKEVGSSNTKVKQVKMAICQNCGKSWKVF